MTEKNKELKNVTIIATGGTIASRPDPTTGAVTTAITVEDLLATVPGLEQLANIKAVQFENIPSWSIKTSDMLRLWNLIEEEFNAGADGIVVTHGTDTMEETAFFLDQCHKGLKPLVITGAMRDSSDIGAEGPRNVLHSVIVCTSPESNNLGVLVVMNDVIFFGSEVAKIHTWHTGAFYSPHGVAGRIVNNNIELSRKQRLVVKKPEKLPASVNYMVPIFKAWTGEDSQLFLDSWQKLKPDGLVIEGTGLGNISPSIVGSLQLFIANNIPVVISTRVLSGGARPIYGGKGGGKFNADQGCILAGDLNAAKARLKLIILMGSGVSAQEIKQYY